MENLFLRKYISFDINVTSKGLKLAIEVDNVLDEEKEIMELSIDQVFLKMEKEVARVKLSNVQEYLEKMKLENNLEKAIESLNFERSIGTLKIADVEQMMGGNEILKVTH